MELEYSFLERINESAPQLPEPGHIFAYRIRGAYRFGRVIRTNLPMGICPPGVKDKGDGVRLNLTYLYSPAVESLARLPSLRKEDLLLPPQLIWDYCWHYGAPLLLPIQTVPIRPPDRLKQHCFHGGRGYVDEEGNAVAAPRQPYAEYRIGMLERLEVKLAQALGIIVSTEANHHEFIKELRSFPTITTLNIPKPEGRGIDVTISIPLEEFVALDVDMYELEIELNEIISPKYGRWVDTLTGAGERYMTYETKSQHTKTVIEKFRARLQALGFRNYDVEKSRAYD